MSEEKKAGKIEKKSTMTTKQKVAFWACNAVTVIVSVLLIVLVWAK